jgi:cystine transport system substrate-binding protein
VLGQAHTPRRRFLPFAAIAVLVLAALAVSGADASRNAKVPRLQARDAELAAKSRAAVLGLYSLDEQLGVARTRLASLSSQRAELRVEERSLKHQLAIARRGAVVAQARLGARLRLLYEQGNVEPLEIVFGSRSLDDAMSSLDNLSRASSQGKEVLRQLQAARRTIVTAQHTLAARGDELARATARSEAIATSLVQTRSARSAYIGSLAEKRRLTQQQIESLVAQAHAAQRRSQELARTTAATATEGAFTPPAGSTLRSSTASSLTAGLRTITVTATGYSLHGRTATGLPVGWGVVAVDPAVIPLGSHLTIPGYGEAVAADTGGSVGGSLVDLWFPTVAQANAWGRRTVTIVLH